MSWYVHSVRASVCVCVCAEPQKWTKVRRTLSDVPPPLLHGTRPGPGMPGSQPPNDNDGSLHVGGFSSGVYEIRVCESGMNPCSCVSSFIRTCIN